MFVKRIISWCLPWSVTYIQSSQYLVNQTKGKTSLSVKCSSMPCKGFPFLSFLLPCIKLNEHIIGGDTPCYYINWTPKTREEPDQTEPTCSQRRPDRPPKLSRRLFPSSDSSSQCEDDGWKSANREDSRCSETAVTTPGTTESWEFKSTQEAPIARLESLEELETSQVSERVRVWECESVRTQEGNFPNKQQDLVLIVLVLHESQGTAGTLKTILKLN